MRHGENHVRLQALHSILKIWPDSQFKKITAGEETVRKDRNSEQIARQGNKSEESREEKLKEINCIIKCVEEEGREGIVIFI